MRTFKDYIAERIVAEYTTPEKVNGSLWDGVPEKHKMTPEEEYEWISQRLPGFQRIFKLTKDDYFYGEIREMMQRMKQLRIVLKMMNQPALDAA